MVAFFTGLELTVLYPPLALPLKELFNVISVLVNITTPKFWFKDHQFLIP